MKRKSILGLLLLLALLLMSASICLAGGGTIGAHMDQHGYHTYSRTWNESNANLTRDVRYFHLGALSAYGPNVTKYGTENTGNHTTLAPSTYAQNHWKINGAAGTPARQYF